MKFRKSLVLLALLGGTCSLLSGCDKENEIDYTEDLTPVKVKSVYDGMVALYQTKNYTFDIQLKEGTSTKTLPSLKFRQDFIGHEGTSKEDFIGTMNDGTGIFNIQYEDDYLPGEYIKDENGANRTSLWNYPEIKTMYGVAGSYIKSNVSKTTANIVVTNKTYILGLLNTIGYNDSTFFYVDSLSAKYINSKLMFVLSMLSGNMVYTISVNNVGTTTSEMLTNFRKAGGTSFVPNASLSEMRRLIKLNNYIQQVCQVDGHDISFIGYNHMTEHYFYERYSSVLNGYAYMEVEHVDSPDIDNDYDMKGIYLVSFTNGNPSGTASQPINTNVDIVTCQHYPSLMKIWNNMEVIKKGNISQAKYQYTSLAAERYYFTDPAMLLDFQKNNSMDVNFPDCTPVAVAIELKLDKNSQKDSYVVFHYLMKYIDNEIYDCVIPFMQFGNANPSYILDDGNNTRVYFVDETYKELNNKNQTN